MSQNSIQVSNLTTLPALDLLDWLSHSPEDWHIHKAQVTHSVIRQDLPIPLIYHYEALFDELKTHFPLSGNLLKRFNQLMTREQFLALPELADLTLDDIAKPWQIKFMGKLVIFTQQPEVAMRLWWTNTLKDFELVYSKELSTAIASSFKHWQFIDTVEMVCKTPNIHLFAQPMGLSSPYQLPISPNFEPLPSVVSLSVHELLNDNRFVQENWLPSLMDLAKHQIPNDLI